MKHLKNRMVDYGVKKRSKSPSRSVFSSITSSVLNFSEKEKPRGYGRDISKSVVRFLFWPFHHPRKSEQRFQFFWRKEARSSKKKKTLRRFLRLETGLWRCSWNSEQLPTPLEKCTYLVCAEWEEVDFMDYRTSKWDGRVTKNKTTPKKKCCCAFRGIDALFMPPLCTAAVHIARQPGLCTSGCRTTCQAQLGTSSKCTPTTL